MSILKDLLSNGVGNSTNVQDYFTGSQKDVRKSDPFDKFLLVNINDKSDNISIKSESASSHSEHESIEENKQNLTNINRNQEKDHTSTSNIEKCIDKNTKKNCDDSGDESTVDTNTSANIDDDNPDTTTTDATSSQEDNFTPINSILLDQTILNNNVDLTKPALDQNTTDIHKVYIQNSTTPPSTIYEIKEENDIPLLSQQTNNYTNMQDDDDQELTIHHQENADQHNNTPLPLEHFQNPVAVHEIIVPPAPPSSNSTSEDEAELDINNAFAGMYIDKNDESTITIIQDFVSMRANDVNEYQQQYNYKKSMRANVDQQYNYTKSIQKLESEIDRILSQKEPHYNGTPLIPRYNNNTNTEININDIEQIDIDVKNNNITIETQNNQDQSNFETSQNTLQNSSLLNNKNVDSRGYNMQEFQPSHQQVNEQIRLYITDRIQPMSSNTIYLATSKNQDSITIELTPQHLGTIRVNIEFNAHNSIESVVFNVAKRETHDLIMRDKDMWIKEALQGIKADNITVSVEFSPNNNNKFSHDKSGDQYQQHSSLTFSDQSERDNGYKNAQASANYSQNDINVLSNKKTNDTNININNVVTADGVNLLV